MLASCSTILEQLTDDIWSATFYVNWNNPNITELLYLHYAYGTQVVIMNRKKLSYLIKVKQISKQKSI